MQQLGYCTLQLWHSVADPKQSPLHLSIVREKNDMVENFACLQLDTESVTNGMWMCLHVHVQRLCFVIHTSLVCRLNQIHFGSSCLNHVQGLVQPFLAADKSSFPTLFAFK